MVFLRLYSRGGWIAGVKRPGIVANAVGVPHDKVEVINQSCGSALGGRLIIPDQRYLYFSGSAKNILTLVQQKVKEKVNHNTIIIPGLVAVFRAELTEEFGWNVLVGPEEAARIPSFLKSEWMAHIKK